MIDDKKEKCDICGKEVWFLTYDCVSENYLCKECNTSKKEHTEEAIEKAFKKLWQKVRY